MSDLQSKTDEELNVMLAELTWFERVDDYGRPAWRNKLQPHSCALITNRPGGFYLPQFCSSLDEVAKVIRTLTDIQLMLCREHLIAICERNDRERLGYTPTHQRFWHAEPKEVAEALIQTLQPQATSNEH